MNHKWSAKRFLAYITIVFGLASIYLLGGYIFVDRLSKVSFTGYSVWGLIIIGIIRYTIFEYYWRKLK